MRSIWRPTKWCIICINRPTVTIIMRQNVLSHEMLHPHFGKHRTHQRHPPLPIHRSLNTNWNWVCILILFDQTKPRILLTILIMIILLHLTGSHYSNNAIAVPTSTLNTNHSVSSNPSPSPVYDGNKYSTVNNKALKYSAYGQRDALHTPPMSHSSVMGSQKTVIIDDEPALDLRNSSTKTSASSLTNATQVKFGDFNIDWLPHW